MPSLIPRLVAGGERNVFLCPLPYPTPARKKIQPSLRITELYSDSKVHLQNMHHALLHQRGSRRMLYTHHCRKHRWEHETPSSTPLPATQMEFSPGNHIIARGESILFTYRSNESMKRTAKHGQCKHCCILGVTHLLQETGKGETLETTETTAYSLRISFA